MVHEHIHAFYGGPAEDKFQVFDVVTVTEVNWQFVQDDVEERRSTNVGKQHDQIRDSVSDRVRTAGHCGHAGREGGNDMDLLDERSEVLFHRKEIYNRLSIVENRQV